MKGLILLLCFFSQSSLCFAFQQANISAFVYHRFGDDRFPSTNIDLDKFEEQLIFLKDNGYLVLSLGEALIGLKEQDKDSKIAVITIDDAYKSFYINGWPLLKQYGFAATLYVNTKTVGASDFMDWDELKEVQEAGIEIGNHSHAHPYFLNDFEMRDFINDLDQSNKAFENGLKHLPKTYAYPYGEWNQDMANVLDSLGYTSASAQNSGVIYLQSDRFSLPRFPMSNDFADMKAFKEKLNVNALDVNGIEVYKTGSMGSEKAPRIIVSFNEGDLDVKSLQVFVQGNEANKSLTVGKDGLAKLTISPKSPIDRRRTLFTITVPNRKGEWSWYSYSWVIPSLSK
ncbi:polysaccharide deacetylase family protein [Roseivirga sp. E12]|uniref:polysaccharide deacetylase family protein n=1 Tax=Roseivirga sp. E12 TaxID=2819237 RepID=UPI001ABC766C|nr:polysaccharide deacetylase family protein [Roseivirga sp. E12]MBO3697429.1 polysaccharide deacetylase family protein [Roseivirga sp. E12]